MSKPWQILSVQWGQNHLKIWPQKCVFFEKLDSLTLTNTIQGIFPPCVVGGTCGQNLIPTWTVPTEFWGSWGVSNHPQYQHQNDHFWLKLNCLTLTFNKWVNFFSLLMGRTCGQNLVPTWTIPTKFWGCWGVSNHPKYQHQNNHFWLILNWLTLTFNRLVNFFPCLIGGTCGQNLVATWTIPTMFWGCWGCQTTPSINTNMTISGL